jgi:2-phosphosulfolactate phosphatase
MIDVLLTPADLPRVEGILPDSQAVVLDVLRATSTIVTALHHGAAAVRLFDSLDAARAARREWAGGGGGRPAVLAGEQACVKPADFDVGNSPREHVTEKVGGATVLLATTNGTRAAVRARAAKQLYAASLLNASATAGALLPQVDALHTVLVCAGTAGSASGGAAVEDVIGAGAILFSLLQTTYRTDLAFTDNAWMAYHTFAAVRQRLPAALRLGAGGLNVIEAGLEDDIDTCARLDAVPVVVAVEADPLRAVRRG